MKTLLLALLFLPAVASAQPEWSTYCDNGVEKVRLRLTFEMGPIHSIQSVFASAYNNEECYIADPCATFESYAETDIGDGLYLFEWQGWLRSCLSVDVPAFYGQVWYYTQEPGYDPVLRMREFDCQSFEPSAIIDNTECTPLPVLTTSWGAVKAMYR